MELVRLVGGTKIWAHDHNICTAPCPIHAPSDHHMVRWDQIWRGDRGIMERECRHGVGHPDPDDIRIRDGRDGGVHGCDGCCYRPREEYLTLDQLMDELNEL